jgi:hypothetical protein
MNYQQLVQAVGNETNRPDLVGEIQQGILEATLMAHTIENFYKDITEALVVFDNPLQYIQQLDMTSLPLCRNIAYIRKTNIDMTAITTQNIQGGIGNFHIGVSRIGVGSGSGVGSGIVSESGTTGVVPTNQTGQFDFLKRVDIGDILDTYGYEKQNIWYQAGNQINMKSNTAFQFATIGYYKYPNIDITGDGQPNFQSWIANELPFVIIYRACASVHAKISEDKAYAMYMRPPVPGRGDESGGLFYQQLAILKRNNILAGEG